MYRLSIIFLFVFFITNLSAQSDDVMDFVKKLFPKNKNISYIQLYGYLNNQFEIQFYLGYNESEWKGICYYPSSRTKIPVEGGIVRNKLILNELNSNGLNSGMWQIDLDEINIPAIWRNLDGSIEYTLNLKKLDEINKSIEYRVPVFSGYSSKVRDIDIFMNFCNTFNENISATLYNLNENVNILHSLECRNKSCDSFKIVIKNKDKFDNFSLFNINKDIIDVNIEFLDKSLLSTKFIRNYEYLASEISYLTPKFGIYIAYPKFGDNTSFEVIQDEIKNIFEVLKTELQKYIGKNEPSDYNKLKYFVIGTFESGMINDNIYSGILTIQNNYNDNILTYPLIFDLQKKEKIDIFEQFDSDFNYKFFIKNYLRDKIRNNQDYKTSILINYLSPELFKNVSLSDHGILFSTDFNTIFGTQKIILPYSELKGTFKRKSILKKLIED